VFSYSVRTGTDVLGKPDDPAHARGRTQSLSARGEEIRADRRVSLEPLPVTLTTSAQADYTQQAAVIDLAVAVKKLDFNGKKGLFIVLGLHLLSERTPYDAVSVVANQLFKIYVHPNTLRDYWKLLKAPNDDANINAFLKRTEADPALRKQVLEAAKSYEELAKVAAANGLAASPAEMAKYFSSWEFLASMMKALLDRKVITEAQFQERAGFSAREYSASGMGRDLDQDIMAGVLSATGWVGKMTGLSNAKVPMAAIIFPATVVIVGGLEGKTFEFKQLGEMFAQSFLFALEGMVAALENFRETIGRIF
jgi:hypothetical protein